MERLTERYTATEKPDGESDVWVRNHDYTMVAERLADYEDTGLTPEQIRELKERDEAKSPDYEGDGYDNDGNIIYDIWICPNCGEKYEVDCDDYDFCPKCGQRLNQED